MPAWRTAQGRRTGTSGWTGARLRLTLIAASAALGALAVALYLAKQAPPECARLLPESQAILYLDLRPLRAATHFDQRPVPHDADYQRFVARTGIDFERDLDQAAFAFHRSGDPLGPNGPVAYSEVFAGRFDHTRLTGYLADAAGAKESYAGHTIYSIQNAGRTVRVAVLSRRLVAVSNTPTSEQIHSILDRYRSAMLPFGGPTLLSDHYRDVPVLSQAWGLGQLALPFGDHGEFRVLGLTLPLHLDATFVASLRWTGALHLRLEEIAPSEAAASASAGSMEALINFGRLAENNLPAALADENVKSVLNSARVTHARDRAVLTASLPTRLLERLLDAPAASKPPTSAAY